MCLIVRDDKFIALATVRFYMEFYWVDVGEVGVPDFCSDGYVVSMTRCISWSSQFIYILFLFIYVC